MATVMLKLGFILHYKMRSDSCFDMALWVIKPYAVEFYSLFGDDAVDSLFFFFLFVTHFHIFHRKSEEASEQKQVCGTATTCERLLLNTFLLNNLKL